MPLEAGRGKVVIVGKSKTSVTPFQTMRIEKVLLSETKIDSLDEAKMHAIDTGNADEQENMEAELEQDNISLPIIDSTTRPSSTNNDFQPLISSPEQQQQEQPVKLLEDEAIKDLVVKIQLVNQLAPFRLIF